MVPFGCANEECGRDVGVDVEGAGIMKEGNELEEGAGNGDTEVCLGNDTCQRLL